jgi:hypothetical protein
MKVPRNSSHARAKASGKRIFAPAFTVFFYSLRIFARKTAQCCATRLPSDIAGRRLRKG